jgi:DNA repair exonuclease SbcCD ATPase subunit
MSVNAINAADTQQQKKSNMGAAVGTGAVLGTAGAVAGHFLGGKTPTLEEVFAQEPDTFEASMEKANKKDEAATKTLREEMKNINEDADVVSKKNALKDKLGEVETKINGITEYDNKAELDKKVTEAQNDLAKEKTVKIGEADTSVKYETLDAYKADKKALEAAEKELAGATEDAAKQTAQAKIDGLKPKVEAFKSEAEALETANKNVFDAKKAKFDADETTKALREELSKAADEFKTAKKTLIDKLKDNKTVTEAFGKVKKALTEGKGKAAAIWGGIALAVGLIAGAVLGGKKEA